MKNFSDILNHIKERFSNPLLFSFICSWFVFNWEITVSLIWYDAVQLKAEGFVSIFSFIKDKLNKENGILFPILFALFYTFLIPILKNFITAFYSWVSKWGSEWNFKILKDGKISIDKYLKLKNEYDKRSKILEEVITSESKYLEDYNTQKTELLDTKSKLNAKSEQETKLKELIESKTKEIENHQNKIAQFTDEQNRFKIIYAKYGKGEKFIEVTNKVRSLIFKDEQFNVNDDVFEFDPFSGAVKELYIEYSYNNKREKKIAIQGALIEFRNNELNILTVEETDKNKLILENQKKLSEIFNGDWSLTYSKNGEVTSEKVRIDIDGQYFSNDKHSFYLTQINITNNLISFKKKKLEGRLHSTEQLKIINSNLITGNDSVGYKLEYKKA